MSLSVSTTGDFAVIQAESLLGQLAVRITRTIKSRGVGEVHDLRVAIRRFTRILVALKPCFPRSESRKMRRALKKIMMRAGEVRNRDIALHLMEKLIPDESGPLARQFKTERAEAAKTLAVSLRRWVRRNLPASWRRAAKGEGEHSSQGPVGVTAARILPEITRELFSRGKDAARPKASAEEIHGFRIAAKNLRYTLDVFAPLYGASLDGLLKQLKGAQTLLGDINDCATMRRMLSSEKGAHPILAGLKKRQRRKTAEFRELWDTDYSAKAVVGRWTDILSQVSDENRLTKKPPARSTSSSVARRGANARSA